METPADTGLYPLDTTVVGDTTTRTRHRMLRATIGATGILAAAAIAWHVGRPAPPPREVGPTARVEPRTLDRIVVATGTIEPEREVEVRPRVSGIVEEVLVQKGDEVRAGAPLVRLDRDLVSLQVTEARAQLRSVEVDRGQALLGCDRARALFERGITSARARDDAEARLTAAIASVDAAQARLALLERQRDQATITAPYGGTILDVFVKPGNAVSSVTSVTGGTPLLTIADMGALHLDGLVDENEIEPVRAGQPVRILAEAYGDRVFRGRVTKVTPTGQRLQNVTYYPVEVRVDDDDASLLRPRMSADGEIVTVTVQAEAAIPETALRHGPQGAYVDVIVPGDPPEVMERAVTIGIVADGFVEVRSGLHAGQSVLIP